MIAMWPLFIWKEMKIAGESESESERLCTAACIWPTKPFWCQLNQMMRRKSEWTNKNKWTECKTFRKAHYWLYIIVVWQSVSAIVQSLATLCMAQSHRTFFSRVFISLSCLLLLLRFFFIIRFSLFCYKRYRSEQSDLNSRRIQCDRCNRNEWERNSDELSCNPVHSTSFACPQRRTQHTTCVQHPNATWFGCFICTICIETT